jgi:hypothetical protein
MLGDMLRWDFDYLRAQLPRDKRFDVFHVHERLVMSHSVRYSSVTSESQQELSKTSPPAHGRFARSAVTFMTFGEFMAASARRERADDGPRPYLGLDLLRRTTKEEDLLQAALGPQLRADLSTFQMDVLRAAELPALSSMHLFVGMHGTVYHCHYGAHLCTRYVTCCDVCALTPASPHAQT